MNDTYEYKVAMDKWNQSQDVIRYLMRTRAQKETMTDDTIEQEQTRQWIVVTGTDETEISMAHFFDEDEATTFEEASALVLTDDDESVTMVFSPDGEVNDDV